MNITANTNPLANLFRWKPSRFAENFGDFLGLPITNRILDLHGISSRPKTNNARLLTIGSIVHFARRGDTIWGSGIRSPLSGDRAKLRRRRKLDIRAVRGPLTRQALEAHGFTVPAVYGDPALLLPKLFDFPEVSQEHDFTIVTHWQDTLPEKYKPYRVSALSHWDYVIARIRRSRIVLSSSLHGLIVAESFGIPAVYLRLSTNEPLLKFEDYYAASGREPVVWEDPKHAINAYAAPPPVIDTNDLLSAFPFDLWYPRRA